MNPCSANTAKFSETEKIIQSALLLAVVLPHRTFVRLGTVLARASHLGNFLGLKSTP